MNRIRRLGVDLPRRTATLRNLAAEMLGYSYQSPTSTPPRQRNPRPDAQLIDHPGARNSAGSNTQHLPISGQHCREAFLQVLDEILGNLQRREMSPGFGRPPSDDLPVPLLRPGVRTLLDVAGIHSEC